jgi:tight adherence protein B
MSELFVLILVFVAVGVCVFVFTPLLVDFGLERTEGRYRSKDGTSDDPIYRFTTPERLLQTSWSMCILAAGLATAIPIAFGILNPFLLVFLAVLLGYIAFQLPGKWLNMKIKKRRQLFESRLVDLVMGLSTGLRSGAALPQSLEMLTRDMGGPIGEEFAQLLHEYRLGVDMPDGLAKLCRRMPSEDLNLIATAVRVTLQAGGSLAEVLDKISGTIRERTEFYEKLRTMTAQGRFEAIAMALAPLAAFLLLYMIDSELMKPFVTTKTGWMMFGVMLGLEGIGFFFINKIVSVEV